MNAQVGMRPEKAENVAEAVGIANRETTIGRTLIYFRSLASCIGPASTLSFV
jgi:hypothetical protein